MDASSLEELVFDPAKCSKLSIEQKSRIVYEVSKWSDSAEDILHAWSRQEILQVLCFELGKERKYTGFTKSKIIEQLLKIVYEKQSHEHKTTTSFHASPENCERTPKRQRKSDQHIHLAIGSNDSTNISTPNNSVTGTTVCCKNSACKAKMSHEDMFCKRCSCCICRRYDDNKDPSLWLICNSDPTFHGKPCGVSCHLECALRHENSGISKDRQDKGLDGSFCCVSCGKVNDLLSAWRKQIVEARDTRRVDILCYRLSLGQKILAGTKHYQNVCEIIDEAVKKLEEEVGPLTGLPVKMARGIVNRLSSGPEIQKMCASAVKSLDSMLLDRVSVPSECKHLASNPIRLEDISESSVTVVLNSEDSYLENVVTYTFWHRKADSAHYPQECTCRLFPQNKRFLLSGLSPDTEFCLKVVTLEGEREVGYCEYQFRTIESSRELIDLNSKNLEIERNQSPATNCTSTLSNPSSVEDETNNVVPFSSDENGKITTSNQIGKIDQSQKGSNGDVVSLLNNAANIANRESSNSLMVEETSTDNGSNTPSVACGDGNLQTTPRNMLDNLKEVRRKGNRRKVKNEKGINVNFNRDNEEQPQIGSSSKKKGSGVRREEDEFNGVRDGDFEDYVKVMRRLESEGHIESSFRQKFLTWYSLRATAREIRVVKVFIETFFDDLESLAEQLVDTFSDAISKKRCCTVPSGFCTKLWH